MSIIAEVTGEVITFRVKNDVPYLQQPASTPGGIGLENLRRRLNLLYPGKHSLSIENNKEAFVAELKLRYEH